MSTKIFENTAPIVKQKPPMILVYTNDDNEFYRQIYSSLNSILPENTNSIFHISTKAFVDDQWIDELIACIIVADQDVLTNQMKEKIKICMRKDVKLICNRIPKTNLNPQNIFVVEGNADMKVKETENNNNGDIVSVVSSNTDNILSLFCNMKVSKFIAETYFISYALKTLGFEVSEWHKIPDLTPGYFICQRASLKNDGLKYHNETGGAPKLGFFKNLSDKIVPNATFLPVKICDTEHDFPDDADFNVQTYFLNLKTNSIGRALLFIPVCETTINISKSLRIAMPDIDGILVVAGCQTHGIGRTGNQWISPKGCAMFTFNYNIPMISSLFQEASFLEYIFAVSVCDAIKSFPGWDDFHIGIKWPNDIYYKRECKIGGTMITSELSGSTLECIVSAGINVANSKPTICINDLISKKCEKALTVEEVIAKVLTKFEHYITLFEQKGKNIFLEHYYNYWLHTNEQIEIQHADTDIKETVIIKGLDEQGHLQVEGKESGKIFCVQEDGNTFDMMKGLIRSKTCS